MAITDESRSGIPAPRPPRVGTQKELIDLLFAAAGLLHENFAAVAAEFALSALQARALACLDPELPMSMRQLASAVGCDASTVTDIVDRLEEMGLVERRPDPVDRRVKGLAITASGLSTRAQLFPKVLSQAPIARLAPAEQAELGALLAKLVGPGAFPGGHGGPPPMPAPRPRDER